MLFNHKKAANAAFLFIDNDAFFELNENYKCNKKKFSYKKHPRKDSKRYFPFINMELVKSPFLYK
jgi:hypothetical protein